MPSGSSSDQGHPYMGFMTEEQFEFLLNNQDQPIYISNSHTKTCHFAMLHSGTKQLKHLFTAINDRAYGGEVVTVSLFRSSIKYMCEGVIEDGSDLRMVQLATQLHDPTWHPSVIILEVMNSTWVGALIKQFGRKTIVRQAWSLQARSTLLAFEEVRLDYGQTHGLANQCEWMSKVESLGNGYRLPDDDISHAPRILAELCHNLLVDRCRRTWGDEPAPEELDKNDPRFPAVEGAMHVLRDRCQWTYLLSDQERAFVGEDYKRIEQMIRITSYQMMEQQFGYQRVIGEWFTPDRNNKLGLFRIIHLASVFNTFAHHHDLLSTETTPDLRASIYTKWTQGLKMIWSDRVKRLGEVTVFRFVKNPIAIPTSANIQEQLGNDWSDRCYCLGKGSDLCPHMVASAILRHDVPQWHVPLGSKAKKALDAPPEYDKPLGFPKDVAVIANTVHGDEATVIHALAELRTRWTVGSQDLEKQWAKKTYLRPNSWNRRGAETFVPGAKLPYSFTIALHSDVSKVMIKSYEEYATLTQPTYALNSQAMNSQLTKMGLTQLHNLPYRNPPSGKGYRNEYDDNSDTGDSNDDNEYDSPELDARNKFQIIQSYGAIPDETVNAFKTLDEEDQRRSSSKQTVSRRTSTDSRRSDTPESQSGSDPASPPRPTSPPRATPATAEDDERFGPEFKRLNAIQQYQAALQQQPSAPKLYEDGHSNDGYQLVLIARKVLATSKHLPDLIRCAVDAGQDEPADEALDIFAGRKSRQHVEVDSLMRTLQSTAMESCDEPEGVDLLFSVIVGWLSELLLSKDSKLEWFGWKFQSQLVCEHNCTVHPLSNTAATDFLADDFDLVCESPDPGHITPLTRLISDRILRFEVYDYPKLICDICKGSTFKVQRISQQTPPNILLLPIYYKSDKLKDIPNTSLHSQIIPDILLLLTQVTQKNITVYYRLRCVVHSQGATVDSLHVVVAEGDDGKWVTLDGDQELVSTPWDPLYRNGEKLSVQLVMYDRISSEEWNRQVTINESAFRAFTPPSTPAASIPQSLTMPRPAQTSTPSNLTGSGAAASSLSSKGKNPASRSAAMQAPPPPPPPRPSTRAAVKASAATPTPRRSSRSTGGDKEQPAKKRRTG